MGERWPWQCWEWSDLILRPFPTLVHRISPGSMTPAPGDAGGNQTFPCGCAGCGQGAVELEPCLVLLEALRAQLGRTGREQVQEGRVSVPADAVGEHGALVPAQALPDDPALHPRVEPVLPEHLHRSRSELTPRGIPRRSRSQPRSVPAP